MCSAQVELEYIIKKYKDEPAKEWLEDVVHESLKSSRRVGEAERHHHELVVTPVRAERCLLDVIRVHPDLMVAAMKVDLGEVPCTLELVQELIDDWDRELILHRLSFRAR